MKKVLIMFVASMLVLPANAQFFDRLIQGAKDAGEQAVQQQVNKKVEEGVDKAFNPNQNKNKQNEEQEEEAQPASGWTCPACGHEGNTGKFCNECGAKKPGAAATWTCPACGAEGQTGKFCTECGAKKPGTEAAAPKPKKAAESAYAKSDFIPGDEIFFEDDFAGERMGEFPSKWDLMDGYAEVGTVDGRKVISFTDNGAGNIQPLMNDQQHFLPDVFTLEFDLYIETGENLGEQTLEVSFGNPDLPNWNGYVGWITIWNRDDGGANYTWTFQKPTSMDETRGEKNLSFDDPATPLIDHAWNHFAFSFNKRALKGYVNGVRVMSIPAAKVPSHMWFNHSGAYKYGCISNVRLAKGAVPLYDRLSSDGKIITYAITFEVGKADLKPESMVEITRIAQLMKDNPNIAFEVQGHCDATGSDKVNDPLSQRRAEAIVAALVEQGIAAARLTAVGKGSHEPIASNTTDEGRAKNRRVEFVKK